MRDETEDADTARLPWAAWVRMLPDTARAAVSEADLTAPYIFISLSAVATELPAARASLRRWSQAIQLYVQQTEDVVLAVDEAVANAVEHAYADENPGAVTVFAGYVKPGSRVCVVVSDSGRWRPPLADTGVRGRGVSMMKALTDHFTLHHNENGTTVLLGWDVPAMQGGTGDGHEPQ
ncbi:ATP-binding protein [Kibdelosporangium philippinense]|uniref:ATP-binding protein n=1 Tax=Kibdelosporangium philippinense TaxID=211113 RepID=A0ABS8Z592_9PSEU|nr:ATP-binding protein [Kibdelosporangium philippinense]MCE7003079.1 ATP-binding protein [Kibdelosporangium philippinense]